MSSKSFLSIDHGDWVWGLSIYVAAATLFVIRLHEPAALNFDETHYVRQGLDFFRSESWGNKSHPPFAKWLIGASQAVLGEHSFSWRFPGVLMGAAVVACVYAIMRLFGFESWHGGVAAALTMLNQTLFVQSRIAMMDVYALAFTALSATFLIWSAKRVRSEPAATFGLVTAGVLFGLGTACKWTVAFHMILIWMGIIAWRFTETSTYGTLARFTQTGFAGWRHHSLISAALLFGVVSIPVYLVTFTPFLFMENSPTLIELHQGMVGDVAGNLAPHPYSSRWWEWPIMLEPVWFYFERPIGQDEGHQAVMYVGNPIIYWAGLPVLITIFVEGFRRQDGALLAISGAYFAFWLLWAIIPRELTFFYYYEPAATMLSMAIAAFGARILPPNARPYVMGTWIVAAAAMFIYFYPVIGAMVLAPNEWLNWIWFNFWT